MKRSTVLVFLFGLFLGGCGSSRQGGEEAEVVRHYECLLRQMIHNSGVIFIYYILIFTSFYYSAILILSTFFSY